MTAPQPKRCQAPGCGQPIPAGLRLHPSVVTCSDACHVAYRKDSISRATRDWRKAAGPKSMPEKRSEDQVGVVSVEDRICLNACKADPERCGRRGVRFKCTVGAAYGAHLRTAATQCGNRF